LKKYDDAIDSYTKAMDTMRKPSPPFLFSRARVYALKGDKVNALADLKQAIGLQPSLKTRAAAEVNFKNLRDDPDFKKVTE
jgi:tetratricopeptide (TPR) repeat protein